MPKGSSENLLLFSFLFREREDLEDVAGIDIAMKENPYILFSSIV